MRCEDRCLRSCDRTDSGQPPLDDAAAVGAGRPLVAIIALPAILMLPPPEQLYVPAAPGLRLPTVPPPLLLLYASPVLLPPPLVTVPPPLLLRPEGLRWPLLPPQREEDAAPPPLPSQLDGVTAAPPDPAATVAAARSRLSRSLPRESPRCRTDSLRRASCSMICGRRGRGGRLRQRGGGPPDP